MATVIRPGTPLSIASRGLIQFSAAREPKRYYCSRHYCSRLPEYFCGTTSLLCFGRSFSWELLFEIRTGTLFL